MTTHGGPPSSSLTSYTDTVGGSSKFLLTSEFEFDGLHFVGKNDYKAETKSQLNLRLRRKMSFNSRKTPFPPATNKTFSRLSCYMHATVRHSYNRMFQKG